jgi:hypothetical protein
MDRTKSLKFKLAFSRLVLLALLSACAPGETVTVRLVTGLEHRGPAPDLMKSISRSPELQSTTTTPSFPCIQSDIRAGFGVDGTNEVAGIPVPVLTNSSIQNATVFWGQYNSAVSSLSFPEIRLQLPRNVPLSVGIIGSITTGPSGPDGACLKLDPTVNITIPIFPTYSMFGAREFPNGVSNETEISVRVWGIFSSTAPDSTSCSNGDCPSNRFVSVSKIGTGTAPAQVRIRYFAGKSISFDQHLVIYSSTPHFIPRAGLARVQMLDVSDWIDCTANGSAAIDLESSTATTAICGGAGGLEFVPLF